MTTSSRLKLAALGILAGAVVSCSQVPVPVALSPGSACPEPGESGTADGGVPSTPADSVRAPGWVGRMQGHICRGGMR